MEPERDLSKAMREFSAEASMPKLTISEFAVRLNDQKIDFKRILLTGFCTKNVKTLTLYSICSLCRQK